MVIDPVELLRSLIRIDTTNPPGNEMMIIRLLCDILSEKNVSYAIQETDQNRGNLLALIPATHPQGLPPIVLISHTDVVGADGKEWTYPPFAAEIHDGYIYGRGTIDTKQLTVMELVAFIAMKKEPFRKRDIYFLATCDEEKGSGLGMQYLMSRPFLLEGKTIDASMLFNGSDVISEGGGFPVIAGDTIFYLCEVGQKSCGSIRFCVKNRVSSNPFMQSGDAIARAMGLVQELAALKIEATVPKGVREFENSLKSACGNVKDWETLLSHGIRNILSAMRCNTLTPTIVRGKNNLCAEILCDVRLLPGFKPEDLFDALDDLSKKWDCTYTMNDFSTGYESNIGSFADILERATIKFLDSTTQEIHLLPFISTGASDGHFLAPLKANVYGYSPVLCEDLTFDTAVRMVHGVDERIHEKSVIFGCDVLAEALRKAACT